MRGYHVCPWTLPAWLLAKKRNIIRAQPDLGLRRMPKKILAILRTWGAPLNFLVVKGATLKQQQRAHIMIPHQP